MLTTPLQVKSIGLNGKEHLEIWQNGEMKTVPAPFDPYLISLMKIKLQCDDYDEEEITVRPLDTLKPTKAYKYSFPEVNDIRQINRELSKYPNNPVFENHVPFIERVAIDRPDFYKQYPEKLETHLVLDIETLTDNYVDKKKIISIATKFNGGETCHVGTESEILDNFISEFVSIDPDIVIHFNGKSFDLPRILHRCVRNDIDTSWLNRDDSPPVFDDGGRIHRIVGRLNYDLYDPVKDDQTLFGLKSRGLKSIARHFGIDAIEEETYSTIELLKDLDRLRKYNISDVRATKQISDSYLQKDIAISNLLDYPIEELVNPKGAAVKRDKDGLIKKPQRMRSGFDTLVARLIAQRGMLADNYIESGQNRTRYPKFYKKAKRNIQGAEVNLLAPGLHQFPLHVDYKSMYPSIQMSMNISPETVRLHSIEPYNPNDYWVLKTNNGKRLEVCIPDKNLNANIVMIIEQSKVGIVPQFLREAKKERQHYKDKQDAAPENEKNLWQTNQWGIKILMNGVGYGANEPPIVRYGSTLCAIAIAGMGRYMLNKSLDYMKSRGYEPIEYDTDGIWFKYGKPIYPATLVNDLNDYINKEVSKWGMSLDMEMEGKLYKKGYWYRQKNYVVKDMEDKVKVVGGAFLNRKKPRLMDIVRDKMAVMRFQNLSEVDIRAEIKKMMKIDQYDFNDLTMNISLNMAPQEYKNKAHSLRIAEMYEQEFGTPIEQYSIYSFLYGEKDYIPAPTGKGKKLDYPRYRQEIATMAANFGWEGLAQPYVKNPGFVAITGW